MMKHYLKLPGRGYLKSVLAYPEPQGGEVHVEIATTGDLSRAMAFSGLDTAEAMARTVSMWAGKEFMAGVPEPAVTLPLVAAAAVPSVHAEAYAGDHGEACGGPGTERSCVTCRHRGRPYRATDCMNCLPSIRHFPAWEPPV